MPSTVIWRQMKWTNCRHSAKWCTRPPAARRTADDALSDVSLDYSSGTVTMRCRRESGLPLRSSDKPTCAQHQSAYDSEANPGNQGSLVTASWLLQGSSGEESIFNQDNRLRRDEKRQMLSRMDGWALLWPTAPPQCDPKSLRYSD